MYFQMNFCANSKQNKNVIKQTKINLINKIISSFFHFFF